MLHAARSGAPIQHSPDRYRRTMGHQLDSSHIHLLGYETPYTQRVLRNLPGGTLGCCIAHLEYFRELTPRRGVRLFIHVYISQS